MRNYCRVTANGLAHLFVGLDYGSICVCGRKVFAVSLETEKPTVRDVLQEPPPPWQTVATPERIGNARFLL
jgi:hypothetical protein